MEPKIIASAKIKVHRYCAFMNSCGFLKAFEHLPEEQADSPTTSHLLAQLAKPVLTRGASDPRSHFFPFTEAQSLETCLKYAGEIIRRLEVVQGHIQGCPHNCHFLSSPAELDLLLLSSIFLLFDCSVRLHYHDGLFWARSACRGTFSRIRKRSARAMPKRTK